MKKILFLMMLLSTIAFGENTQVNKNQTKLILEEFQEAQLSLNEVVILTSYVESLDGKKGILYIIANSNEKDSYIENEELSQERIKFVSNVIKLNKNVNQKGINYKKISLANTQSYFGKSNLSAIQLLFIESN